MEFHLWLAFVAASVLILSIPGPTVLLVVSYALTQGRRVALSLAAGVALGDLIAMTASLAGLGALVLASATLFTVLKWVGALYLIFLGIKLIRDTAKVAVAERSEVEAASSARLFTHATMVTALNPKSIMFFIAFVPQFLDPAEALAPQFTVLIVTFVGLAAANAFAYALLADQMRRQIARESVIRLLSRLGGGALIAMGVAAALYRRAES